ncbi:MAG: peptidoglycan editing factor PgeF [Lachnospiraceae bacterium]|nr:peptidoglycan editing factor PgeF [Lachnospiraceae bacterium]
MEGKNKSIQEVLRINRDGELEYLTFPALSEIPFVKHLFTTRLGGVSEGIFATMNLSYTRGDEREAVDENYRRIGQVLGCELSHMVLSHQTHTTNIRRITREDCGKGITRELDYENIDGMITNVPGIMLVTFYADCVPLYFVDTEHRAIGLSHSGWKGTVNRMGAHTLQEMKKAYGTDPEKVVAAIGPSICQSCYEVSEDVIQEFRAAFPDKDLQNRLYERKENGKYQLDLWEANREILLRAGVPDNHISVTDICTCCNPTYLFSHRASHGKRGNLAAFLGMCET